VVQTGVVHIKVIQIEVIHIAVIQVEPICIEVIKIVVYRIATLQSEVLFQSMSNCSAPIRGTMVRSMSNCSITNLILADPNLTLLVNAGSTGWV
jgi:hypothetical protein